MSPMQSMSRAELLCSPLHTPDAALGNSPAYEHFTWISSGRSLAVAGMLSDVNGHAAEHRMGPHAAGFLPESASVRLKQPMASLAAIRGQIDDQGAAAPTVALSNLQHEG